jgi:adsorption protein B
MVLSDYRPQRDGRIGDYLVRKGVATEQAVARAMEEQRLRSARLQSTRAGTEQA